MSAEEKQIYSNTNDQKVRVETVAQVLEQTYGEDCNENVIKISQLVGHENEHRFVELTTRDVLGIAEGCQGISIGKFSQDIIRYTAEKDKLFVNATDHLGTLKSLAEDPLELIRMLVGTDNEDTLAAAIQIAAAIAVCELRERRSEDATGKDMASDVQ